MCCGVSGLLGKTCRGGQLSRGRISRQLCIVRYVSLKTGTCALTQFEMFLGHSEQLCYPWCNGFSLENVAISEHVLANEEPKDINKMSV